jgi:hypothetical protein
MAHMCEDDDLELKHSALDYFMVAFLPNSLKHILILTNKSLQKNKGKEIEFGKITMVLWSGLIDHKIPYCTEMQTVELCVVIQVHPFTTV